MNSHLVAPRPLEVASGTMEGEGEGEKTDVVLVSTDLKSF